MREIKHIVIHCTATQPESTVESIKRYWKEVKKWKQVGYHYLIAKDGFINYLASEDQVTNGVGGHNQHSIHVSYIGGIDKQGKPKDTRTIQQLTAMKSIVARLMAKYPKAKVLGHRDFEGVSKACPSFDVESWLQKELLTKKSIT